MFLACLLVIWPRRSDCIYFPSALAVSLCLGTDAAACCPEQDLQVQSEPQLQDLPQVQPWLQNSQGFCSPNPCLSPCLSFAMDSLTCFPIADDMLVCDLQRTHGKLVKDPSSFDNKSIRLRWLVVCRFLTYTRYKFTVVLRSWLATSDRSLLICTKLGRSN